MKIGTQNQAFFPENILEKFRYIKEMGFDGFEIDGKLLVNNIEEVKAAIKETDRKSTRLNSSHTAESRMPSSA